MDRSDPPSTLGGISGVVLHVDAYGEQPSEALTYFKTHTHYIAIGRRPTQRKDGSREVNRALFRCPVVSRKHAKITFTEFGNAYIIDLNSHHGTHILRPGETVSRKIEPDSPTVLADGDVLTFGKSVGKDETLVRPVTVRVKLMFGPQTAAALPYREDTPERLYMAARNPGRYGIPRSEDVSSSSSSDGDSDVEVIPSPLRARTLSRQSTLTSGRLALLRHLLPPIHSPPSAGSSPRSVSPDVDHLSFYEEEVAGIVTENALAAAEFVEERSPELSHIALPEPNVIGAYPDTPSSAVSPISDVQGSPEDSVMMAVDDMYAGSERGYSMDRALAEACDLDFEPVVADCRSLEDAHKPFDGDICVLDAGPGTNEDSESPSLHIEFGQGGLDFNDSIVHSYPAPSPEQGKCGSQCTGDKVADAPVEGANVSETISSLERQLNNACNDITLLRLARRNNEDLFEEHVREAKTRLDGLRDHMDMQIMPIVRVNASILADVQSHLNGLQEQMVNLETRLATSEDSHSAAETEKIDAYKALLEEMRALRDETGRQIAAELEAIKAARVDAEIAINKAITDAQLQMTTNTLKRKFSDIEDADSAQDDFSGEHPIAGFPKRRKTLKVVSRLAQTVTFATVGAIAAWTALAYA